jgi:hypothetical protein
MQAQPSVGAALLAASLRPCQPPPLQQLLLGVSTWTEACSCLSSRGKGGGGCERNVAAMAGGAT